MIAVLDGDVIAYTAAIAQQQRINWGDTVSVSFTGSAGRAREMALRTVVEWTKAAGCKRSRVSFGGPNNFRRRILPSYKMNRTGEKPFVYTETVAAIRERFRCDVVPGLEGDDVIGVVCTTDKHIGRAVAVSIDKDMRSFPGLHFNPRKDREPVSINELEADQWWMIQAITGDPVDGYTGCPGAGIKRAQKAIQGQIGLTALWRAVVNVYRAKRLTEDDALVQARVARILRAEDWNKQDKLIRLWHPTTPLWIPSVETPNE